MQALTPNPSQNWYKPVSIRNGLLLKVPLMVEMAHQSPIRQ